MRLLVHGMAGYAKGGIETFVFSMAEHMPDGIVFDYVVEKNEKNEVNQLPGGGDVLMIEPKRRMFANLLSWLKLLGARKKVNSAIYFNWYSMAWLFPAMIARLFGYRVFIHAHTNNLHDCGILQRIMHSVNRVVQRYMNITRLTNSELSAKFFFGNKPAKIIYNAIDIERFTYNEEIRKMMRMHCHVEKKHVYGFAGRMAYEKNTLFLMEIFKEIKKIDSDAAFVVCGDGNLMDETKEKASNLGIDVFFAGSVSNIQDYFQAMDVFILPSRFEGLGLVLIEAQCSGLPCVASADVVPQIAKVTDLVEFVKLADGSVEWAKKAKNMKSRNREEYASIIMNSNFNIAKESSRLKSILCVQ
ncbi:glycosyltransferase [uncultured Fibrobacter sp.]|uniref:glycosyltransferase n=1 Tax=uncultured Fibrobacter sp. TaxID=261512 RepID=UPI00262F2641|nr:glycosyltransferase [uncultured Fibrobacter sp.]